RQGGADPAPADRLHGPTAHGRRLRPAARPHGPRRCRMIPGTLARRYAQALLSLATSAPQRDRFARDMAAVANIVQQRDEAGRTPLDVLSADRFPADQRKKLLQTLARRVMADPIVLRFLEVVFDRQRIDGLPQIARTYQ